ncbi:MAG: acetyl-CoA carboxylase carboxyltransferase subunit alpha [Caldisericia bacterium]|nr:acetyl-CoA carboxylase carboxyltransferase subunit alpha [Caldisericia bacterium]
MIYLDFEKPVVELEKKLEEFRLQAIAKSMDLTESIKQVQLEIEQKLDDIYNNLTRYQIVQVSRHIQRPKTIDYIRYMTPDYLILHGDRELGDDNAMLTAMGTMDGQTVFIMGHNKGRNVKENIKGNFGSANPEGYRKAIRMMRLAEKFKAPVITLLDTPGAYPGLSAEEHGQAEAIATSIRDMFDINVPIVTVVIGEGGSGGALGIGVGDRVLMMKYSMYSVISPEGCASILFRDGSRFRETSQMLKPTAKDLYDFGLIDEVIEEPIGGAHRSPVKAMEYVKQAVKRNIAALQNIDIPITEFRYNRYKNLPPQL